MRFLGHRDGQELIELFQMADALCVPSRNEPFGIVVLEAWSAGKPVVATMNGGPNEYVRHGVDGLKIYANPDSVAWGLGTLFADWDAAREMGRRARSRWPESFTWDVIAGKTLDVYESLLTPAGLAPTVETDDAAELRAAEPDLLREEKPLSTQRPTRKAGRAVQPGRPPPGGPNPPRPPNPVNKHPPLPPHRPPAASPSPPAASRQWRGTG